MTLSLDTLDFLASAVGERYLAELVTQDLSEAQTLTVLTQLRRDLMPEQAAAVLMLARLRQKAVAKFGDDARHLYFTADALEQASDPLVREYRAQQIGGGQVLDVCCGIGSDSLALAQQGATVSGIDSDPLRIALARLNAAALGLAVDFRVKDAYEVVAEAADVVFFDPGRRDGQGRRIYDVERYQPPLSLVRRWDTPRIVVKLSPGVDVAQLRDYGGGLEFISVAGELKEAVLWLGGDQQGHRATRLSSAGSISLRRTGPEPDVPLTEPRAYLSEPDPAVLRAGLVRDLAAEIDAAMLDPEIAYLTSDHVPASAWLRTWRVIDWLPYQLKRLRATLRERGIGRVTVKKRGSPLMPEQLIPALRLKGDAACTLILTQHMGRPIVMICDEAPVAE